MIPRRDPRGATLLLALLILGGLVATSITVATIVATQLRSGQTVDAAVAAAYAAESGGEELLYAVRKASRSPTEAATGILVNGATWERAVTTTTSAVHVTLGKDDIEQLDLLDPSGTVEHTGIRTLVVTPRQEPEAGAWLEVTWVPWMLETAAWAPVTARTLFGKSNLARDTSVPINLRALPSAPEVDGKTPAAFRVRLRAIGAAIGRVQLEAATDGAGTEKVPFPSRVRATVIGTMGRARQAFAIEFPLRSPLASVFDAALSAECDIVKGDEVKCPMTNSQ